MTGIWADVTKPRKVRKSPRALRFAEIKVGDQLMQTTTSAGWRGGIDDMKAPAVPYSKTTWYYIVTDMWFDPVAGQRDPVKGQMIGIQRLDEKGEPISRKVSHPIRGLASNRFHYADRDYIAFCKTRIDAMNDGAVVGIGMAGVIRRRPKVPGRCL